MLYYNIILVFSNILSNNIKNMNNISLNNFYNK
jgi:hypothetical protein